MYRIFFIVSNEYHKYDCSSIKYQLYAQSIFLTYSIKKKYFSFERISFTLAKKTQIFTLVKKNLNFLFCFILFEQTSKTSGIYTERN